MFFKKSLFIATAGAVCAIAIFSGCTKNPVEPNVSNGGNNNISVGSTPDPSYRQYVGDGYNSTTGLMVGNALTQTNALKNDGNYSHTETYDLVSSKEEFSSSFDNDLNVAAGGTFSGVKADASFESKVKNSFTTTSNSMSIVVMSRYDAGSAVLNANYCTFISDADTRAKNKDLSGFSGRYGNCYVKQAFIGGLLVIRYTATYKSSSSVKMESLRAALSVKASCFQGNMTDDQAKSEMTELNNCNISSYMFCTDSKFTDQNSGSVTDGAGMQAKLKAFQSYYDNARASGLGKYYVFAREFYNYASATTGNSYTEDNFPVYLDLGKVRVDNLYVSKMTPTSATLNWTALIGETINGKYKTYIDGFDLYYMAANMTAPALISSYSNSTRSCTFTIPTPVSGKIFSAWVTPKLNGYKGVCMCYPSIGTSQNPSSFTILPQVSCTWFNSRAPYTNDNMYISSNTAGFTNNGATFLLTAPGFSNNYAIRQIQFIATGRHEFYALMAGASGTGGAPGMTVGNDIGQGVRQQIMGTVPIYEMWNPNANAYLLTIDLNINGKYGWQRVHSGCLFGFVYPTGSTITDEQLKPISSTKWFKIVSRVNSNLNIDVSCQWANGNPVIQNGSNVQVWGPNGATNQNWQFQYYPDGSCRIIPRANTALCLDVSTSGGVKDGSNVDVANQNGASNQSWIVEDLSNGYFKIHSLSNQNLLLNVNSNPSVTNGSNVQVWSAGGQYNENWQLVEVQ